jgi:hypothetical protein
MRRYSVRWADHGRDTRDSSRKVSGTVTIPHGTIHGPGVLGERSFLEKLKGKKNAVMKGNVKDQPSYRRIKSTEAEEVLKQAAGYFRLSGADLTKKRGGYRQERAVVMELIHRHSGISSGRSARG